MGARSKADRSRRATPRECAECGHRGSDNDASTTLAYCAFCGATVPMPVEDHCSSCHQDGCMGLACPKCGGDYLNVE